MQDFICRLHTFFFFLLCILQVKQILLHIRVAVEVLGERPGADGQLPLACVGSADAGGGRRTGAHGWCLPGKRLFLKDLFSLS